MPIYEFSCGGCGLVFEHLAMRSGDEMDLKCPACGCAEIGRVMSVASAVVTGGGTASAVPSPQVQNRSCGKESSCTTLTLPGHTR